MSRFTTLATAAAFAAVTTVASAGGLSPEIMEAPVVAQEAAPAGSSINPAFVVVGVLAALLIASSLSGDDEDNGRILLPCEGPCDTNIVQLR
ncbi:hypothetical protein [Yoonia vestfoldensis]|uniref:hypothetical protein n=1 Tax=Yoonia vestfoldensis TaxID=245188 RepID=UPI0003A7AC85|nr:hypothetical protein [Yoonia vestfoldensis]